MANNLFTFLVALAHGPIWYGVQTSKFNSNLVIFENQSFRERAAPLTSRNIITPLQLLTLRVSQIDREIKVSLEISRLDKHEDAREMNPSDTFMLLTEQYNIYSKQPWDNRLFNSLIFAQNSINEL